MSTSAIALYDKISKTSKQPTVKTYSQTPSIYLKKTEIIWPPYPTTDEDLRSHNPDIVVDYLLKVASSEMDLTESGHNR